MPRRFGRLKQRKEFLRVAAAKRKWVAPGLLLQVAVSPDPERAGAHALGRRVGFTASKKVGNAVARNRAKRRLRALAREMMGEHTIPRHDYVLIAREDTVERSYTLLRADLEKALRRLGVWRDPP